MKGQMFATSNMEVVDNAARQGYRLLYVGDQLEIPSGYKFVNALTLTPDYQAMAAVVEGNMNKFSQMYINMLMAPMAEELFAIIVGALVQGASIMIYFPYDSLQLQYPYILLQYMNDRYGISVGDKERQFSYNSAYDNANMRLLYVYKLIPWQDYILYTDEVDPITISRFREDLMGQFGITANTTNEELITKIQQAKDSLMQNTQKQRLFDKV